MFNYSVGNIKKLIKQKKDTGYVRLSTGKRNRFVRVYSTADAVLLAEVANLYLGQNGKALKKIMADMYHIFGDQRFKRLANVSVSHLYNLKQTRAFKSQSLRYTKTKPTVVSIGERREPRPDGKPGFIRVDSVHQGDARQTKGCLSY